MLDVEFQTNNETLALLGASGCGKSMTLRCIAGIEKPDEGRIVLNDRVLFDKEKKIDLLPRDRKVGLLFQNYALFPNMTLRENIAIGIPKHRKDKAANKIAIEEKIQAFSLVGLEDNYPSQLSGGQQQRVALARMLLNEPEILMLDEPFSALDEHLRWRMEQELILLLREYEGPSLYVSHNRDEVYRICDTIAVLNDGSVEEFQKTQDLFENPKTISTSILTGCKNNSKAIKQASGKYLCSDWDIELSVDKNIDTHIDYIGIRAHDLELVEDGKLQNTFKLRVKDKIQNMFSYALLFYKKENLIKDYTNELYVYVSKEEYYSLECDEEAYVRLPIDKLLLLKEDSKHRIKS